MTGEELFMLGWSPILAAIWRNTTGDRWNIREMLMTKILYSDIQVNGAGRNVKIVVKLDRVTFTAETKSCSITQQPMTGFTEVSVTNIYIYTIY